MSGIERPPADLLGFSRDRALEILQGGDVTVLGLLPYSSNYTFLARVDSDDDSLLAVYKPRRGETPLWDFPSGSLAAREVATWLMSEVGGWDLVPPTVLRNDAPLGEGSLQTFIEHDPDRHFFVLMEEGRHDFERIAAFDVVVNNADRKAGHILEDRTGKVWAVDHGLTFNLDPKLRTVIWQFADHRINPRIRSILERLREQLASGGDLFALIAGLLSVHEADATLARIDRLLSEDRFPAPAGDRPLPWPLI